MAHISVVIPVYKADDCLEELYRRLSSVLLSISGDYEIIFVEDCGGDNSWEVMQTLRKTDGRVKIIRLTKNFGQHNALMCGLSLATGQYVVTMDDDLQNPPEEIEKLINAILGSDYDVQYEERELSAFESFLIEMTGSAVAKLGWTGGKGLSLRSTLLENLLRDLNILARSAGEFSVAAHCLCRVE